VTLRASADAPSTLHARARTFSPAVRFLAASGMSFVGDWLTTVALVVARAAPRVVGPLPGGALADRYGPARVAATCALLQAMVTASIVVFAENRLVWAIYATVVVSQLLGSAAQPCYGALVPRLTTPDRLGRVQGAYSALQSSSILVGPAVGALVLPFAAPEILIAVDAVSFLVAAVLLATLLKVARGARNDVTAPRDARIGLRLIARDPMLRFLAAASVANPAAVTALQAVLVVAAAQHFGHDTVVGWLYAAVGAGGLLGTFPVIRRTPVRVGLLWIIGPSILELAPLALFVFVSNLPLAMLLLFTSSFGATLYQTRGTVGLQQRVPTGALARANAVIGFAIYVGMLAGAVAALALVQPLGWQSTVLVVCAASATLLFFTGVSEGRRSTG
jgi:MFS family permease